jgi:seryl-tRNA synthetase
LSAQGLSLDLKTFSNNLDVVLSHLKARKAAPQTLEAATKIASLVGERNTLIQTRDGHLNSRKKASATVGKFMRNKDNLSDEQLKELEAAKVISTEAAAQAEAVEEQLATIQSTMDTLLAGIPNLLDDIVPHGTDESDNEEVSVWGDTEALPKKLGWAEDFVPKWHDDVAIGLNGYQSEAAVQMSGARFVALSGVVAQLERAIGMFFMDMHTKKGYTEVAVPLVVSRSTLEGTSQLPKFEEDLFAITTQSHTCNGEDAFLIPTAEVPVTNLHRNTVLEEADLPIQYVAWTPCFRAEAGSYGRDTKGLIRTHQFQKVELVKICTPETSPAEHEALTQDAEACLQALELPYRKVRLCSGDVGFAARHCYDLEVWLPGAGEYREISSCSNCGDFQARRMGLRYRPKAEASNNESKKPNKTKPVLCHTMNGSGLAVGRTLVAVLENYQQPDGSVVVPKALRAYMGGKEVLEAPSK